jgi:hypothetical protein
MKSRKLTAAIVASASACACNAVEVPDRSTSDAGARVVDEAGPTPDLTGAFQGPPGVVSVSDAAAAIDPNAAYSVTFTMTPFTVPAGGEVYKCQDFANPFGNQAVDIDRYDLQMNQGSHHMLLFYTSDATDGPLVDCPQGGLQIGPYTFGAQSQKVSAPYPPGIGAAIPAGMGFTVDAHYLNPTTTDLQAAVQITMFVARPGAVTQHAGALQFILTSLSVPPTGMSYAVSGSCALPQDVTLLWANSHMHQRATHFVATTGSTTLYETNVWSDPMPQTFSPPLRLSANATIDWACTYVNDTGSPLTFGESAATNAMCNFGAAFYPVQDPSNPLIQCLQ